MPRTTAWERTQRVRRRETTIAESHQTTRTWKHHRLASSPAPLHPLQPSRVCPACLLVVTVEWRSDALTPCSCWYQCCLWDSTVCSEPQQIEKCTGCPRVRLKVRCSKLTDGFQQLCSSFNQTGLQTTVLVWKRLMLHKSPQHWWCYDASQVLSI